MQITRKFLFDDVFDNGEAAEAEAEARRASMAATLHALQKHAPVEEEPPAPAEPVFSQAELAEARSQGHETGRAEALAERGRAREDLVDVVLAAIPDATNRLSHEFKAMAAELERQSLILTRAILVKAVPTLSRHQALAEIDNLVRQCLRENLHEPRIVLRVSNALFDRVEQEVLPATSKAGFTGQWIILADDTLANGACRLEWADGGAERDPVHLLDEIDRTIRRALGISETEPGPDGLDTKDGPHGPEETPNE